MAFGLSGGGTLTHVVLPHARAIAACSPALSPPHAGFAEVHVGEVPHALSHAPRAGREWLGLWRRCDKAGGGSSTRSTSAEGGASEGGAGGPARL